MSIQQKRWLPEQYPLDIGRTLNVLSIIGGLILWEIVGRGMAQILLAPPSEVVVSWIELVADGRLQTALLASIQHMFLGYFIAIALGIPLGFMLSQSKLVRWALNPYIDMVYSTPIIAYLPIIIVWFGLRFQARVFMVFMFCIFEIIINVQQGVTSVQQDFRDVGRSFDLGRFQAQRKIVYPASLPHVFAGLRLGIGRAVRGMIVAELFLAIVNLGAILTGSSETYNTAVQLAVIITISITGVIAQEVVTFTEHRTIPWYHTTGEE